jgi:excisionase family DNA binding protein
MKTKGNDDHGVMNVSEVARELGVAAKTIREWSSNGSLPCKRTPSGWRVYDTATVNAFKKARNA